MSGAIRSNRCSLSRPSPGWMLKMSLSTNMVSAENLFFRACAQNNDQRYHFQVLYYSTNPNNSIKTFLKRKKSLIFFWPAAGQMAINKGGYLCEKSEKYPQNPYFFSRLRRDFHFSTSFGGFLDIFLHFLFYKVFNQSNSSHSQPVQLTPT